MLHLFTVYACCGIVEALAKSFDHFVADEIVYSPSFYAGFTGFQP